MGEPAGPVLAGRGGVRHGGCEWDGGRGGHERNKNTKYRECQGKYSCHLGQLASSATFRGALSIRNIAPLRFFVGGGGRSRQWGRRP